MSAADEFSEQRGDALRWTACFSAVVAAHGVAAFVLLMNPSAASDFDAGAPIPVVMELPEIAAAPAIPPNDVAPGPPEPESDPTPPPPDEQIKPPEEVAELALPIPDPPKPQPPVEERPPTSTPSVQIPPSENTPPTPGAEVTPRTNVRRWESELAAHLERFKRYPSAARQQGEQGIVRVAFTLNRNGRVLSSHIVQSSGSPLLDEETLAMLARAQPMPRPPEKIADSELSFVVPVRFTLR